jgi:hypothetical protein
MKHLKYTSIHTIISSIYRDTDQDIINGGDVIEWAAEALEHIGCVEYKRLSTAFVEVNNYRCELPSGCTDLLQILKRNSRLPNSINEILNECNCLDLEDKPLISEQPEGTERLGPCGQPVILDCQGIPIEGYNLAYYRPYFDYVYWYFSGNRKYQDWSLVRLASHNFFPMVATHPELELHANKASEEYNIMDNALHFSFKEGYVAISYYKMVYDKNGYPMIPDEVSIIRAITEYCKFKIMQKMWYKGREGYTDKWQEAEKSWHWYCRQAKNKAKMLTAEELDQLTLYMTTLLPRNDYWASTMKSYGLPEDITYIKNTVYARSR